jgi:hypothetical protein
MQNSTTILRSPLQGQENWPVSGPIYGVPQRETPKGRAANIWTRVKERLSRPSPDDEGPKSPVYY